MKYRKPWRWDYFHLWYLFEGVRRFLFRKPSIFGDEINKSAANFAMKKDEECRGKNKGQ